MRPKLYKKDIVLPGSDESKVYATPLVNEDEVNLCKRYLKANWISSDSRV